MFVLVVEQGWREEYILIITGYNTLKITAL